MIKHGSVKHGLIKHRLIKHGSVKQGLIKRGLMKRRLVKNGLILKIWITGLQVASSKNIGLHIGPIFTRYRANIGKIVK